MPKNSFNVAEAKQRLADLLGRVAYGRETIIITRRGRPMAKLTPVDSTETDRHLSKAEGWLDDDDPYFASIEAIMKTRARTKLRPKRG